MVARRPLSDSWLCYQLCGALRPGWDRGLRSSVATAVVEAASQSPVVLGGQSAGGPGLDVVDLTVVGGNVAELVEALAVSDLHGPAGGAGKQPALLAHVDDP